MARILNIVSACLMMFCLLIHIPANAQEGMTNVYISHSGTDRVGKLLAYQIRERIRKSSGMMLVDSPDDAAIHYNLVTLNPDDNYENQTIYSGTMTVTNFSNPDGYRLYVTSWVGNCGMNKTAAVSESIAADIDEYATSLRKIIREMIKKNTKDSNELRL